MITENTERKNVYCAVYTRKSTSEGLEQDFNSLDAQRESCMAYIASQKGEGWIPLQKEYDDGGFTGANIERPALQELIKDIENGKVNCIVVYKVDRLSRSLLDFAKLLEFFDKYQVTFVSVTQHFNTNNSMGRLTLNILLSFAQFEREIISERTKDKMGAARKKGKWLGGRPAIGYDTDRDKQKLVINPKEAESIRFIFETYIKEKSVMSLLNIIREKGITTKQMVCMNGKEYTGHTFYKSSICRLLQNPLYIGKVKYNNELYEGEHEAIIDEETFYKVQNIMAENVNTRNHVKNNSYSSLLRKMLFCKHCDQVMIPTYASKKQKKYQYYLCKTANVYGYSKCPTKSVSKQSIEESVVNKLLSENIIDIVIFNSLIGRAQRVYLQEFVDKIYYNAEAKNIAILLKSGQSISYTSDVKVAATSPKLIKKHKILEEKPKISKELQSILLAYQIEHYMRTNNLNQKQCANFLGISGSRLCQIINFEQI